MTNVYFLCCVRAPLSTGGADPSGCVVLDLEGGVRNIELVFTSGFCDSKAAARKCKLDSTQPGSMKAGANQAAQ